MCSWTGSPSWLHLGVFDVEVYGNQAQRVKVAIVADLAQPTKLTRTPTRSRSREGAMTSASTRSIQLGGQVVEVLRVGELVHVDQTRAVTNRIPDDDACADTYSARPLADLQGAVVGSPLLRPGRCRGRTGNTPRLVQPAAQTCFEPDPHRGRRPRRVPRCQRRRQRHRQPVVPEFVCVVGHVDGAAALAETDVRCRNHRSA